MTNEQQSMLWQCCTCPSWDMWYACPIESETPESKKLMEEFLAEHDERHKESEVDE